MCLVLSPAETINIDAFRNFHNYPNMSPKSASNVKSTNADKRPTVVAFLYDSGAGLTYLLRLIVDPPNPAAPTLGNLQYNSTVLQYNGQAD